MYLHVHKYRLESGMTNGHGHIITGRTDSTLGLGSLHFHNFCGVCSHNGHSHYFSGITGLPIKTENGHIHRIEGILEMNNLHEHKFSSFTSEEIEYIGGRRFFAYRRWAIGGG